GLADRPPLPDQPPRGAEPELALIVTGRHPVRRRERAVDGEPAPARGRGQVGGRDVVEGGGVDQLPGPPGGGRGAGRDRGRCGGAAGGPGVPAVAAGSTPRVAARRTIEWTAVASNSSRRSAVAPPSSARCRARRLLPRTGSLTTGSANSGRPGRRPVMSPSTPVTSSGATGIIRWVKPSCSRARPAGGAAGW